jgi:hypothetical protein
VILTSKNTKNDPIYKLHVYWEKRIKNYIS